MRARTTIAAASIVLVTLAVPAAAMSAGGSASDKFYFDETVKLAPSEVEDTADRFSLVADVLSDICDGTADKKTAINRIRARGGASWIKRGALLLLSLDSFRGVDSPCAASLKYQLAAAALRQQKLFMFPNCFPWNNPSCKWKVDFRRRLDKIERRFRPDYCRLKIWPQGLLLEPTVIKYPPSGGC